MTADNHRDDTRERATRNLDEHALFLKLPDTYYQYAIEWLSYPHWTLEETANLLTGCVPHRQMFLRGEDHKQLDMEVLETENRIRAALKTDLEVVKSQKYFGKTYLLSQHALDWAKQQKLELPADLLKAEETVNHRYTGERYTTPCLEAISWTIENFWEHANLRDPPSAGAIIQAMLQEFPELSGQECDWVEKVTRHPLTRPDPL